jgi:predicted nucleic acid-binding protein
MIIVVADTAPLRYLVQIQYEHLLPRLYTRVWIPGVVLAELRHEGRRSIRPAQTTEKAP